MFRDAEHEMVFAGAEGHAGGVSDDTPVPETPRPEAMRALVRDYVRAVHTTYLDHVQHLPPGERATLPLVAADEITVVAAAAQRLHLIATTHRLPTPVGREAEDAEAFRGVAWTVRFYDPSVLPDLGLLVDDSPAEVRRALGVTDTVYHLAVAVGGGLGAHHAQHSGVALANQHARTGRDLERVRRALPHQIAGVDELGSCVRNGLDLAAALLAAELTSGRVAAEAGTPAAASLESVVADVTS